MRKVPRALEQTLLHRDVSIAKTKVWVKLRAARLAAAVEVHVLEFRWKSQQTEILHICIFWHTHTQTHTHRPFPLLITCATLKPAQRKKWTQRRAMWWLTSWGHYVSIEHNNNSFQVQVKWFTGVLPIDLHDLHNLTGHNSMVVLLL